MTEQDVFDAVNEHMEKQGTPARARWAQESDRLAADR
jgi:hypothetical protein